MIVEFDELSDGDIFESLGLRFMLICTNDDGTIHVAGKPGTMEGRFTKVFVVDRASMDDNPIHLLESWDDVIPEDDDDEGPSAWGDYEDVPQDMRKLLKKILLDVNDGSQYVVNSYKDTPMGPMVFLCGEGWKTRDQIDRDYAVCVEESPCQSQH